MLNASVTLISVILCLILFKLAKRWKYYKLHYQLGGPIGLPLIGVVHKLMNREEILINIGEHVKKHGGIFLSWLGPLPFLVLSEPSVIQEIFTSPHCINKSIIYKAIHDTTGPGLFSIRDPLWSLHRKVLNPAFSHKVLLSFFTIFNQETNRLVEKFEDYANGESFDCVKTLRKFTLNVAVQTTMGKSIMTDYENEGGVLQSYCSAMDYATEIAFMPWLRFRMIRRILGFEELFAGVKLVVRKFVWNLIDEELSRDANEENTEQNKNIFLNIALEQHKKGIFSLRDVESEANVIVIGAFETSANTIAYTLLMLAMHPKYQEQLFDEIQSLFPDKDCMDISYEATTQMVYMDMVINEAMRIMAPVPMVARQAAADIKLSNGIVIPKGTQIGINIFELHRNKQIWGPDAHTFNPDHFLPANLADKHPYAFIPFTKGTRNCIGWRYALLSAKIALAKLLRNYRFTTDGKLEDLIFMEAITLKLKNFPQLQVHKRV